MASFRLRLAEPKIISADDAKTSFHWLPSRNSTIYSNVGPDGAHMGPRLRVLGQVRPRNIDLVRIAVAVYAADRSLSRSGGGSNWNSRPFDLTIPVLDPEPWRAVASEFTAVVDLLTGDQWSFKFVKEKGGSEQVVMSESSKSSAARVVLLSGGADSAVGALLSRSELGDGESHTLVSHYSSGVLAPRQREVASLLETLVVDRPQHHVQVHLGRAGKQLDGKNFPNEQSTRSRSLLFIALGLAMASLNEVPLWIPENGFASLNPPLGRDRLGSVSTRTTHPRFLEELSSLLDDVGGHGAILNPFISTTKGEMFNRAAELVGRDNAADLLSRTNSCAHTGQRSFGVSTATPCGVCFGCVVRRAAFRAAGLRDETKYISGSGHPALQAWLDSNSVERAVRRFAERGVTHNDLIAMSLPESYKLKDALDLCRRAIQELEGLFQ
jgi:7-cyano-7-deazaguanine synthase in queuosine biosynthesis